MINKTRSPFLVAFVFSILILVSSTAYIAAPLDSLSSKPSQPSIVTSRSPDGSGAGLNLNLTESVNGYKVSKLNTTNSFSGNTVTRLNDSLSVQVPINHGVFWQNITLKDMKAGKEYRAIQDGYSTKSLQCGAGGVPNYRKLATNFTTPNTVNLTKVWIYYGTFSGPSGDPPNIPLNIESDSSGQPSSTVLGSGILQSPMGPGWRSVDVSSGGKPVTLSPNTAYWLVMDGSTISNSKGYYAWYYSNDTTYPSYDRKYVAGENGGVWGFEAGFGKGAINLLSVLLVDAVSGSLKTKAYSSPSQVQMRLNGTLISENITSVNPNARYLVFETNSSVTFTLNWTARFERVPTQVVSTNYLGYESYTLWNASFRSEGQPPHSYTLYNRTLRVCPICKGWDISTPTQNITSNPVIPFIASFTFRSGYLLIVQTGDVNASSSIWSANWVIRAKCIYMSRLNLDSSTLAATWGDRINVRLQFLNTTQGVVNQTFPGLPTVKVNDSTVSISSMDKGNYSFDYHTYNTLLFAAAGAYNLRVAASYGDFYDFYYFSERVFTLVLAKVPINLTVSSRPSVTTGESYAISATLRWINGSSIQRANLTFSFDVVYKDGSSVLNAYTTTLLTNDQGTAYASFDVTDSMARVNATVTYLGTGIIESKSAKTSNIEVLPRFNVMLIVMAAGGSGGAVIAVVAARRYSKGRKLKEEKRTKVLVQTASLAQLIVVDLKSGRSVFSRSLGTEEAVDSNLISGFLSANQAILGEVFKKKGVAGLKSADYGEYKVVSHVGKYVMSTLFCTEAAGEELSSVLEEFTGKFEKKYGKTLESWDGDTDAFKDAEELADELFALPLTAPYMLAEDAIAKEKLSGTEKRVVQEARRLSAEREIFFMPRIIDFLLTKEGMKRSAILDVIDSLTKKGVIKQLSVKEAAEVIKNSSRQ